MTEQQYEGDLPAIAGRATVLRLLPWATADGNPCFLSADENGGVVSRIADVVEAAQMTAGFEVLEEARAVLADTQAGARELRFVLASVTASLSNALRVAESRGARLPVRDGAEDNRSRLPAAAFE